MSKDLIKLLISENKEKIEKNFKVTKENLVVIKSPFSIKDIKQNYLVQCRIKTIMTDKKSNKKSALLTQIEKILATIEMNSPHPKELNIFPYNITGIISKENIYDSNLFYLNDEIDENLKVNNSIVALVIKIAKGSIFLSLQNSLIKNKHQKHFTSTNMNISFILGQTITNESEFFNENFLKNKYEKYNIEFAKKKIFNFEIMRKTQNYDWCDMFVEKACEEEANGNYEKALEHYNQAEKLDPLCSAVYFKKMLIYLKLNNIEQAKSNIKNFIKIEPEDEKGTTYLKKICEIEKKGKEKSDISFLNKKRK